MLNSKEHYRIMDDMMSKTRDTNKNKPDHLYTFRNLEELENNCENCDNRR